MCTATDGSSATGRAGRTTELLHDIAEQAPLQHQVHRRPMVSGVVAVVTAVAVLTGLVWVLVTGPLAEPSAAEQDQDVLLQVRAQILPELRELMNQRESFLAAERLYLPAMQEAGRQVRLHDRRPTSASDRAGGTAAPDVSTQIDSLQQVVQDMSALGDQLERAAPGPRVTSDAHDHLLSAVHTLTRNAQRNLRVLDRGRAPYPLAQVSNENALTAIRRMNRSLLYLLDAAQLPIADLDLPGGTDKHPHDHSTLL